VELVLGVFDDGALYSMSRSFVGAPTAPGGNWFCSITGTVSGRGTFSKITGAGGVWALAAVWKQAITKVALSSNGSNDAGALGCLDGFSSQKNRASNRENLLGLFTLTVT
jgi:hypothetical protein